MAFPKLPAWAHPSPVVSFAHLSPSPHFCVLGLGDSVAKKTLAISVLLKRSFLETQGRDMYPDRPSIPTAVRGCLRGWPKSLWEHRGGQKLR